MPVVTLPMPQTIRFQPNISPILGVNISIFNIADIPAQSLVAQKFGLAFSNFIHHVKFYLYYK